MAPGSDDRADHRPLRTQIVSRSRRARQRPGWLFVARHSSAIIREKRCVASAAGVGSEGGTSATLRAEEVQRSSTRSDDIG